MKRLLIIEILVLALLLGAYNAKAAFVKIEGYGVVYDNIHNQYWIESGPALNGGFLNTLAFLDTINCMDALDRQYGGKVLWGKWRLASDEDMRNLWSYDAKILVDTFEGNPQGGYYMFGRYGKQLSKDRHYIAGILLTNAGDYVLSPLPFDIVSDNIGPEWLGSWMVADAAQVPVPSTIVLFFSGLTFFVLKRRKSFFTTNRCSYFSS